MDSVNYRFKCDICQRMSIPTQLYRAYFKGMDFKIICDRHQSNTVMSWERKKIRQGYKKEQ